jgi:polysaccharide biosynthesis/export protein
MLVSTVIRAGIQGFLITALSFTLFAQKIEKQDLRGRTEPLPSDTAAPVDPSAYVIGPEDILMVRVWKEPDISGPVAVRPDGKISLQLVNEIAAAGLTPQKLAARIAEGLSQYMTRPEVSVAVQQVNSKRYYIHGEVLKPGTYPMVAPVTVMEALVNSGGFKDFANVKNIVIARGTQRLKFNYRDVVKGKKLEQNITVEPGDQIIVP